MATTLSSRQHCVAPTTCRSSPGVLRAQHCAASVVQASLAARPQCRSNGGREAPHLSTASLLQHASRPSHRASHRCRASGEGSTATAAAAAATTTGGAEQSPSSTSAANAGPLPLRERLSPADLASWDACVQLLGTLGYGQEDADKLLAKAFGWSSQAFWRKQKVDEVPAAAQVQAALDFLQSELSISGADLKKVLKLFPEALACSVEGQLGVAVARLRGEWKLNGPVLTKAVIRQPQVLGYNVDCEGSCIGECNRCWARF